MAILTPHIQSFLHRIADTSKVPLESHSSSIFSPAAGASTYIHNDNSWRWNTYNNYSFGPVNAEAEKQKYDNQKEWAGIILGATFLVGSALAAGNLARNSISAIQNYFESKRIAEQTAPFYAQGFVDKISPLADINHIANLQNSIDLRDLIVKLTYLGAVVLCATGSAALVAGGIASAHLLLSLGTVTVITALTIGAFTWSFDDPAARSKEQKQVADLANGILHPKTSYWSSWS